MWGTATTLAGAAKARTDIGANIGADPRQLKIWLVGFCKFGRWVVGPVEDRPPPSRDPEGWEWPGSSGGWGRMGFMADTLHEALVLRHAAEGARVWGGVVYPPGGHSLAIWQAGSQRRLTQDGLLKGLEAFENFGERLTFSSIPAHHSTNRMSARAALSMTSTPRRWRCFP